MPLEKGNAYFILSDGTEGQADVKLLLENKTGDEKPPEEAPVPDIPTKPILKRANTPIE